MPQWIFQFEPSTTPPYLGTTVFAGDGVVVVGGGDKNHFAYYGRCVWMWTWALKNFFLVYGPLNQWWGSGVRTLGPPGCPPPPPHPTPPHHHPPAHMGLC